MRYKNSFLLALAVIITVIFGMAYRYCESLYSKDSLQKIKLPVPLVNFPIELGNWSGQDIELSEAVQRVAGNDDFVNRWYQNVSQNKGVGFYIAYAGQPRNMLGHRPQICYVGAGWIHEETEQTQFETSSGRTIPCLIHTFRKPSPDPSRVTVLNYYVLNGVPTNKESEFNSLSFRIPNIKGQVARYVAQIQINAAIKSSVLEFATISADEILKYLPDETGKVTISNLQPETVNTINKL